MSIAPTYGRKAARLAGQLFAAICKPRATEVIWRRMEKSIRVPTIVGSRAPGPLDTGIMPIWRGLLEKYDDPRIRYFTLCKAVRVGGTLMFGTAIVMDSVIHEPCPLLWLDPTGATAKNVSRKEIQPFFLACPETNRLRYKDRQRWTNREMSFQNCTFSMVGSGSVNDLGGRQAKKVIINEQDKIANRQDDQPTPTQEAEARTSQFEKTRKIIRNSSPSRESGLTWTEFLNGSQHYCYLPCPSCGGYQRLTFIETNGDPDAWMRIDDDDPLLIGHEIESSNRHGIALAADPRREAKDEKGEPLHEFKRDERGWLVKGIPDGAQAVWDQAAKDKRTSRWDVDHAERTARYQCVFCHVKIRPEELPWMMDRYTLRAHNQHAPKDSISAQVGGPLSAWISWGQGVKLWLMAKGDSRKLHAFWNHYLGLPFPSAPTSVTPQHLANLQKSSPRYFRQYPEDKEADLTLHVRPVCLTMHADVQQTELFYSLRALMEDGSRHVLAWGSVNNFDKLHEIAQREWTYDHGEKVHEALRYEKFSPYIASGVPLTNCIIDSGHIAKREHGVYVFVYDMGGKWVAVKGGALRSRSGDSPIVEDPMAFIYPGAGQVEIMLVKTNDYILQEGFSRFVLKEGRPPKYCLPYDFDKDEQFVAHLIAPSLQGKRQPNGTMVFDWIYSGPHDLYDCEKYGEAICHLLPPSLLQEIRAKQDQQRAKALEKLSK